MTYPLINLLIVWSVTSMMTAACICCSSPLVTVSAKFRCLSLCSRASLDAFCPAFPLVIWSQACTNGSVITRASFGGARGGTRPLDKLLPPLNYHAMCLHTQTFTPSITLLHIWFLYIYLMVNKLILNTILDFKNSNTFTTFPSIKLQNYGQ